MNLGRLTRWLVALALLAAALPIAASEPPAGSTWSGVERIVAVGDVHGDHDSFAALLRAAGVVDERGAWTGGRTHLVQTGDVLDRGPDSRQAMDLLQRLAREAEQAGGRVHALIGNHEALVCLGDLRYVHPGEFAAMGGEEAFRQAFAPEGAYGRWIRGHDAVIRVNDVLFVHGGISPAYANRSLAEINSAVRAELAAGKDDPKPVVTGQDGPLWYRGYAEADETKVAAELAPVLASFGASRVVVGHTVSEKGLVTRCGGRIIMIDVGYSRTYVGAPPACLVIENGKFYRLTLAGREELAAAASPALAGAGRP